MSEPDLCAAFNMWNEVFAALLWTAARRTACKDCAEIRGGICRHGLHPSEIECPLRERFREAEHGIYEALSALAWGFDPPGGYDAGGETGGRTQGVS